MKIPFIRASYKTLLFTLTFLFVALACAEEELMIDPIESLALTDATTSTLSATSLLGCSDCDYVVPAGQNIVDGEILGIKPGMVIGLNANFVYTNINFRNIVGTADQPIIIKNCGGTARFDATGTGHAIKTSNSKHFRITGGDVDQNYGIVITGGNMSINLGGLSTNFEIDHVEIQNSGFAGIVAKTDPSCDDATIRGNFLMEHVYLHHNYIHDTGGEGIYAGNSWFNGMNRECGVRYPHDIHNIDIYKNIIKNSGWDGIQLGCATEGARIFDNIVENYGLAGKNTQNSGIQLSAGTGGLCYNNLIKKGTGNGMAVNGLGDNIIFNNIIDQAGNYGIFCDERGSTGPGFVFLNNTIINPALDGIRIYAELLPMNVIKNNIIANPGNYTKHVYPREPEEAFVYKLSDDVKVDMSNNYFTTDTEALKILNLAVSNYMMDDTSPVVDKGTDISTYHNILTDYYGHARLTGAQYDIGAIEIGGGSEVPAENALPVVYAGANSTVTLPENSLYIDGTASDNDGTIVSYQWQKISGGTAAMEGTSTRRLFVSNLVEGNYIFRLTATDNAGAAAYDDIAISVVADQIADNTAPVANAGSNQILTLPTNSTQLNGKGTDSDGTIASYRWIQYRGNPATISNATSATATISGLTEGPYYFRLTVTDNDGATHSDDMLVRVDPGTEVPNVAPVANAGRNQIVTLPVNSVTLQGSATDSDGSISEYRWTQYGGPTAIISNPDAAQTSVTVLTAGSYYFRLTVTDDDGATHYDNMLVKVESGSSDEQTSGDINEDPQAFAGANQILTVPDDAATLFGRGIDSDGSIESYLWTQYGGPDVEISNPNAATATISGLSEGKYYFTLTVEDNDGATDADNILIRVMPASSGEI